MAVGLLQALVALVLLVRCAATRARRRRAERDLAGLEARPEEAALLPDRHLRALVEGVGELATETHPGFRPAAVSVPLAAALVPRARRMLADLGASPAWGARDRRFRAGSLVLLGRAPHAASLRPLTVVLHGGDPEAVALASAALGEGARVYPGAAVPLASVLRATEGVSSLTTAWALDRALAAEPSQASGLARDPSPRVRRRAVAAAAASPPAAGSPALAVVPEATRDPDEDVRAAACRALGKLPPEAGLALLTGALLDPSPKVAKAAAAALGEPGTRAAGALLVRRLPSAGADLVPDLLRALEGVKGPLPQPAVEWLSGSDPRLAALGARCATVMSGAGAAWPAVVRLLGHRTPAVRTEAARACGAFARRLPPGADRSAIADALLAVLREEPDVATLGAIGDALAASGDPVAAQAILGRMPSLDRPGRERLLESVALGELVGPARGGGR
jgi:HEAT repeat protein